MEVLAILAAAAASVVVLGACGVVVGAWLSDVIGDDVAEQELDDEESAGPFPRIHDDGGIDPY